MKNGGSFHSYVTVYQRVTSYFSGFMVDITIVNRGYFMVYKPTYNIL